MILQEVPIVVFDHCLNNVCLPKEKECTSFTELHRIIKFSSEDRKERHPSYSNDVRGIKYEELKKKSYTLKPKTTSSSDGTFLLFSSS